MKRFAFLLLMAMVAVPLLHAQRFAHAKDAYLGQAAPTDTPKAFAPGLAGSGMFLMGRVAFSHDGTEFYYTQNDSWESAAHAELRMVRFDGHAWSKPVVVAKEFLSPTLSMDGATLFMRKGGMHNLWQAQRRADGWGAPTPVIENGPVVYDYMPTLSGNVYVGSDPSEDDKKNGITTAISVLTTANGKVHIESLGTPLNEPGFNGDLYIAPDESYIIVSAKETKTYESQLYISFRKKDKTWTVPVSLGDKINSGLAHRWGQYVTPDGKYLFYCHGTSEKDCAVYWVRWDKLLRSLRKAQG